MSALLSFLGGSTFRAVWGEASAYVSKRQEHKYELERDQKQAELAAMTHAQNLEAMRVQHELGIKVIEANTAAHASAADDDAFLEAVRGINSKTGIAIIDAWNQAIRPGVATAATVGLLIEAVSLGAMTPFHYEIAAAAIGMYLADRSLGKRGK